MIDFLLGVPGKLKTITDYLTTYLSSTRAAKIDNLDAAISTRAAAATALSSATWTPARAGYLDKINAGGIPGTVKSIQTGYLAVVGGSSATGEDAYYRDITISTVVVAKCVVTVQGNVTSSGNTMQTGRVTGTTTLRVSRDANNNTMSGRWYVVEYY